MILPWIIGFNSGIIEVNRLEITHFYHYLIGDSRILFVIYVLMIILEKSVKLKKRKKTCNDS